jgi:hypothetical protein
MKFNNLIRSDVIGIHKWTEVLIPIYNDDLQNASKVA